MTATQLVRALTKAQNGLMGDAELRTYEHNLLGRLLNNENSVFQNLKALKKSKEQPTKAILFNRQYEASGTDKVALHTGTNADTFEKDISYVLRTQTFNISYKRAANNEFAYEEILSNNIKQKVMNLYEDISSYCVGWLGTNRSQIGVDSLIPFDEVTDYEFDNPLTDRDLYFENIMAAMQTNKYRGAMDVINDQKQNREFRRIANQGAGNSENLQYTIPGILAVNEPQLGLTADVGYSYAWQAGMVGLSTWNEQLNRDGKGAPGDNDGMFTTFRDPVFGLLHDVHVIDSIADTTAAGGNSQDSIQQWEISTIFTVQGAFESTANASPIFRFKQLYT